MLKGEKVYSIGQFSKMTGISNKALIWYDTVGLLKPAKVNIENGYRYYDDESLKKVVNIHFLQEMGFTVSEIKNFSSFSIEEQIEKLQKKVDFIEFNIFLLKKFQEENMNKKKFSVFDVEEKLLQGKWVYRKTTTNFDQVLDLYENGEKSKCMPEYLFFGEGNVGTDLKNVFGYSGCFSLSTDSDKNDNQNNATNFWYFLLNYRQTLVLYEKPKDEKPNEKIKFHVYENLSQNTYTSKEIQHLCEKYSCDLGVEHIELDKNYIGKYKMYDQILESEIGHYNGKVKTKDACFGLDPIFCILDIQENKDVYVMKNDDKLEMKTSLGINKFDKENTKMTISMCCTEKADFCINNFNGQKHRGRYRKIGDKQFLFVDLDCIPDTNQEIYVFEKESQGDEK